MLTAAANASSALIQYMGTGTDHMGGAVAFGDVNGDGIPDIVVGADGGDYVRVFDGPEPGKLLYQFNGVPGSAFGSALATGDINGDGKADVVVGAFAWDGPAGADQGTTLAPLPPPPGAVGVAPSGLP
jgi:FG-GAP-like repeat